MAWSPMSTTLSRVAASIVGDNAASIRVHEACGFELVGVEKEVGRKFGRWLDVVELQRLL